MLSWQVGVTTVPSRFETLLRPTLASLAKAGFTAPRLFVDAAQAIPDDLKRTYAVTQRDNIKTAPHWTLTAWELFLRNCEADRYAIFQDDFIACNNLKEYLERTPYPSQGYLNLYTFAKNTVNNVNQALPVGWHPTQGQDGKGAVGLVFSNEAMKTLLRSPHLVNRMDNEKRRFKAIDGGIVEAMRHAGWKEYVHVPSLLQHTGLVSSMGNGKHKLAPGFRGEAFDSLDFLAEDKPMDHPPAHSSKVNRKQVIPVVAQSIAPKTLKIGLIGANDVETNFLLCKKADISRWLVRPGKKQLQEFDPGVELVVCPIGRKLRSFLTTIDVVVFVDKPIYSGLIHTCQEAGKRTVCILTDRGLMDSPGLADVDLKILDWEYPSYMGLNNLIRKGALDDTSTKDNEVSAGQTADSSLETGSAPDLDNSSVRQSLLRLHAREQLGGETGQDNPGTV